MIKHKSEKMNQGADALSRRHLLISQLSSNVLGFEHLKTLYKGDLDFRSCMKFVKVTLREISWSKRGTCSRAPDFVCLSVGLVSSS